MAINKIFNRLSTRLILAFLLSSVIGMGVVATFAYRTTENNFRSYVDMTQGMMNGGMGGMMGDWWSTPAAQPAVSFLSTFGQNLWIAGLLGVLLAIILGGFFTRNIVAPVGEVATAAKRVAGGDFSQRVKVQGSSELTELGESFNSMTQTLKNDQDIRQNMIADVAHELRTPLSVLRANIEAMQDGVLETSPEALESLHQETITLEHLIADLRTLTLAETGQLKIHREPTDLKALVFKIVQGMQTQFDAKKIVLKVKTMDRIPEINVDPNRIEQVLANLLTNALHYTPEGGRVVVNLTSNEKGTTVSVADNGIGIPSDDLPLLFERFYRVDRSRARSTGGSGLGLAIVKQLVEAHGGKVWVTSKVGNGSEFSLFLPDHAG